MTECLIVKGSGETDLPIVHIVNSLEEARHAVLSLMYSNPADAEGTDELFAEFDDTMADDNYWTIAFEIGGISVERVCLAAAPTQGADARPVAIYQVEQAPGRWTNVSRETFDAWAFGKQIVYATRDAAPSDAQDAARYRLIRQGKALTIRVPVKDKHVTYCIGDKPESSFPEAFDAAVDALLAAIAPRGGMTDRDEFEKWFSQKGRFPKDVERSGEGYKEENATRSWAAWQAARATAPSDAIRPTREQAERAIAEFLKGELGDVPDFTLNEDGDEDSGNKCGWAFWVHLDDTTSYVHRDLKIEWYGTAYIADRSLIKPLDDDAIMSLWDSTNGGQRIRPFILEFAHKVIDASQSKEQSC